MTAAQVMDVIKKDIIFYEESGGGVTFSGGEVFLQDNFLISLLVECRKNDIHTCIDTTGHTDAEIIHKAIPYTNLFLYDLKLMNDGEHRKYCGVSNRKILENFTLIYESGAEIRARLPIVPSVTDTAENLEAAAEFISKHKGVELDILPYHKIGKDKYRRLGISYQMDGIEQPGDERMSELVKFFTEYGIKTSVGG